MADFAGLHVPVDEAIGVHKVNSIDRLRGLPEQGFASLQAGEALSRCLVEE